MDCLYQYTEKISSSSCLLAKLASFGFQIQTQMILILLPLKASMTPWILIVYLKRHSGACVGNKHVIRGKRRDGEYLTDITSFNNGQLKSRTWEFLLLYTLCSKPWFTWTQLLKEWRGRMLPSKHTHGHGCQLRFRGWAVAGEPGVPCEFNANHETWQQFHRDTRTTMNCKTCTYCILTKKNKNKHKKKPQCEN